MGGAAALLSRRAAAFAALAALLAAYYASAEHLWDADRWWDVAFTAFALIPAVFGLVWAVLSLRRSPGLLPVALAFGGLAFAFDAAGWNTPSDFAKLAGVTAVAFWFLSWFEAVTWVVLVSVIVPWVDAYSVWRGPTRTIATEHEGVLDKLTFAFQQPGEPVSADLGLPDLLFFALYLAAAARFRLRVGWTWLAMSLSFGATFAFAVGFDLDGLPALPLLSAAFLLPNADLLWRAVRRRRRAAPDST